MSISWTRIARRIRVPMGFVFALFFLLTAHPSAHSLLWSLLGTLPGIALRAYASGYVTKNTELTTTGPYAYTRNPLYLGSMLIAFGFAVAAHSWWIALALAVLFALIYLPTIRSEEEFLRGHFSDYDEYTRRVPRLIPRLTRASTIKIDSVSEGGFSSALYRKHREYNAALGSLTIYAVLLLKLFVWHRSLFLSL
ncbi:MAG TPA: isoprenylcysteine carboxylmethyltransferase family protein [Acidobacteriaceae bacterium]